MPALSSTGETIVRRRSISVIQSLFGPSPASFDSTGFTLSHDHFFERIQEVGRLLRNGHALPLAQAIHQYAGEWFGGEVRRAQLAVEPQQVVLG